MSKFRKIDLIDDVHPIGPITVVSAEVSASGNSALAIVQYTENDQPQKLGLRLDLDKQVFIDHLDDEENDAALAKKAPAIVRAIVGKLAANGR